MSFFLYDITFFLIFTAIVVTFLYVKRKNLKRDGVMYLYRTSVGLKIINYLGKKYKRTLTFLSYVSVTLGYILMISMIWLLYQTTKLFFQPEFVQAVKIPPLMPLIPYISDIFQVTWLPPFYFTYWIIVLGIIAITHEGAHGIFARFYNVKIKSTGFGFLGPFMAFFVEQDDKQMQKRKIFPQLTILSAGVFANIITALLFFVIMIGFFQASYSPAGVVFTDYTFSVFPAPIMQNATITSEIIKIDGLNLTRIEIENKSYFASAEIISLKTKNSTNATLIGLYQDQPAIRNAMRGAIIKVNDLKITNRSDFENILSSMKPGENITIVTNFKQGSNKTLMTYEFALGEDYDNESKPVIGTASLMLKSTTLKGFFYKAINFFKDPAINYEPKYNEELTIFIYNLLWWIVLISISVGLSNMLPAFVFDGGRFWYLTVLGITGHKKLAERVFKVFTFLLLAVFALLMALWAVGMFF